jgi:hypothetical protein
MTMTPIAPRLHVLLARDKPVGLVIRRGPSKQVATIGWDRRSDRFQVGQWLKGRIYERRSDLSPDGKYLIYFAMNGLWETEAKGSWTAISRAPYLKALAMFPKGDGWHGGGLWTARTTYWLNDGYGHSVMRQSSAVHRDAAFRPAASYGGECPGVYYNRLVQDGWSFIGHAEVGEWRSRTTFEKPLTYGWTLRKIAHSEVGAPVGKGFYWDEHELVDGRTGTTTAQPNWEWADLDGKRLVWAEHGTLKVGKITPEGLADGRLLFDSTDMTFTPLKAPY